MDEAATQPATSSLSALRALAAKRKEELAEAEAVKQEELANFKHPIPPEFAENEDAKQLVADFALLRQSLTDPDMLAQQLRNTMVNIKAHPELYAVIIDDDYDLVANATEAVLHKARMTLSASRATRSKKAIAEDEISKVLKEQGLDASLDDALANVVI